MDSHHLEKLEIASWNHHYSNEIQQHAVNQLEGGKVLYCHQLAFEIQPHETRFMSAEFSDLKAKNISYDSVSGQLKGAKGSTSDLQQIIQMMARFTVSARKLIDGLFPSYRHTLEMGRTSFRPVQISGRESSYRKDDRRLHVDAFPANPNQGRRILRVFSNINPFGEARVWNVGEPFEMVAKRFLPQIPKPLPGASQFLKHFKITRSKRTEYDHIMLHIHDRMKKDDSYQQNVAKTQINFAAASTWIVQTDHVSHAALSGQHLLEQTFYLPVHSMVNPDHSPLKILERLKGKELI